MYKANQTTVEMASFGVEGNIIDHSWYHIIKHKNGKTDTNAIIILSDLVYWYKPVHRIDENTGEHKIYKKFKEDILQRSYAEMEKMFGFTKDQSRTALETLESLGIAERVTRTIDINGVKVSNILFIRFNHHKLSYLMKEHYENAAELKKSISLSVITDKGIGYNPQASRLKPSNTDTSTQNTSELIDLESAMPTKVKIIDFDGKEKKYTKEDIFTLCVQGKYDWESDEIDLVFLRLANHIRPVRDLSKFCDKIIKNERNNQYNEKISKSNQKSEPVKQESKIVDQGKLRRWTEFYPEQTKDKTNELPIQ